MERRRPVVDGLIGALVLLLLLIAATGISVFVASRPAGSTASPPTDTTAVDPAVPSDLSAKETWLGAVQGTSSTVVRNGVRLNGVKVDVSGFRQGPAGTTITSLNLEATVPFDVLATRVGAGAKVGYQDESHITIQQPYTSLGRTVDVDAIAKVSPDGTDIVVTPTSIKIAGSPLPGGPMAAAASAALETHKPVPGLPEGLLLKETKVTPDGLWVRLEGTGIRPGS